MATIAAIGPEFAVPRSGTRPAAAESKQDAGPGAAVSGPDAEPGQTIFEKLKGVLLEQDALQSEGVQPVAETQVSASQSIGEPDATTPLPAAPQPGSPIQGDHRGQQDIYTHDGVLQSRPDASAGARLHVLG